VRVIPVLVDGARPLRQQDLPAELHKLARLNAHRLSYDQYQDDADRLLDLIQRVLASVTEQEKAQEGPDRKAREEAERKASEREGAAATAPVAKAQAEQDTQFQVPQPHRARIFLCYRREDTQGFAGRIYDNLASKYGVEQVFRDIDSTPVGIKYSVWIESRVRQSSVMIVLIGNAWLSAKDPAGQRRLDLPKDWVRREIEAALRHDIPIIPVRIQEARMPSEEELPPSIADLIEFQDAEVTDRRWAYDVGLLVQAIDDLHSS